MDNYLQKELYELVKKDETVFNFIQESLLDGIWYWDLENPENEWMSPSFWETLGYAPDEMQHKSSEWKDIINKEDLDLVLDNFHQHLKDCNHPYHQYVRYKHKNGSTVWVKCWGMAIKNNGGRATRMLGAHQNITELKNKEQLLESSLLKTQKEKQNQNLLVSIISHDLRSKLSSMFPAIRLLEMNNKKDENRENDAEIINLLKASLKGSLSMLDGLLEWGKMITGRTQINREKLNICNIASKVKTELNEVMADKQITITDTSDKELLVYADRVLLEVLIRNLLSNAIKFSYVNGQIEMSCQVISDELVKNQKNVFSSNRLIKDRSMVLFSIKDNGTGISEKRFSKILKAENVGSVAGTLGEKGSGLGLLICKEIIEKHDGHIWAESEEEKGSTFFFAIPEANSIA